MLNCPSVLVSIEVLCIQLCAVRRYGILCEMNDAKYVYAQSRTTPKTQTNSYPHHTPSPSTLAMQPSESLSAVHKAAPHFPLQARMHVP